MQGEWGESVGLTRTEGGEEMSEILERLQELKADATKKLKASQGQGYGKDHYILQAVQASALAQLGVLELAIHQGTLGRPLQPLPSADDSTQSPQSPHERYPGDDGYLDAPAEPGWYWLIDPSDPMRVRAEIVWVSSIDPARVSYVFGEERKVGDGARWYGPLVSPWEEEE